MSQVQIARHEFGGQAADVAELLALPGLRNGVEPEPAVGHDAALVAEVTVTELRTTMDQLVELVSAIDRRLPQVQRAGEGAIANAAMRLRIEAHKRIDQIKLEVAGREHEGSRPHVPR